MKSLYAVSLKSKLPSVALWIAVVASVMPIWAFRYFPSQDGPCHVVNALIIRDCVLTQGRHHEFFEIRPDPVPNWTAEAVLALLCCIVDPLTAEKLLLTGHILAFALAFRYFLSWANPSGASVATIMALALIFNCSLWMGFYNFVISLDVAWLGLGLYLRSWNNWSAARWTTMTALGVLAFFTHLFGFLLLASGIFGLAVLASPRPGRAVALALLSTLPGSLLTLYYFTASGFIESGTGEALAVQPWLIPQSGRAGAAVWQAVQELPGQLFGPLTAGPAPLVLLFGCLLGAMVVCQSFRRCQGRVESYQTPKTWVWLTFLSVIAAAYTFCPEQLGIKHGGFLKQRFALLLPLLLLTIVKGPKCQSGVLVFGAGAMLAVGCGIVNAIAFEMSQNAAIEEYVSGKDIVGRDRVLTILQAQGRGPLLSNSLQHAGDYYCLDTNNINLFNFEAATSHFPVRFRKENLPESFRFDGFELPEVVDTVLVWKMSPGQVRSRLRGFSLIYANNDLMIYRR